MRRPLPPAIALSPLLALWVAVGAWRGAVAAPTGDEPPFLRYAHNLLHGVYATPGSRDATQFLWHGPGLPALLAPLVALAAYRPFFAHLSALTPLRRDLALQHAALAGIAAHPAGYALNLLANVGRMLVAAPFSAGLAPRLVGGYALCTIGLLGVLVWALARTWPHRRRLPRTAAPFAAFAVAGFLIHLAPSAEPRLVMPLVPLLVWLALHAAAVARAQEIVRPTAAGSGHDPSQASAAGAARGGRLGRRLRQRQRRYAVERVLSAERGRDVGRDR